jgi:3-(3-hydroxy-phenyl)propionate hydroxylase
VVQSVPRQDLMPALERGVLAAERKPGVGTLFPQPWIRRDGGVHRLDDICERGFLVVLDSSVGSRVSTETMEICRKLPAQIVRITDDLSNDSDGRLDGMLTARETEGVVAHWFRKHSSTAAIVRPDKYVFALSSTNDELLVQLNELSACLR